MADDMNDEEMEQMHGMMVACLSQAKALRASFTEAGHSAAAVAMTGLMLSALIVDDPEVQFSDEEKTDHLKEGVDLAFEAIRGAVIQ